VDTPENKRSSTRHVGIAVVTFDANESDGRYGITRNLSEKGLLIATRTRIEVGERLTLTIRAPGVELRAEGHVLRVEKTDPSEPWPFRVAVALDTPLPAVLIEASEVLAETFRRPT